MLSVLPQPIIATSSVLFRFMNAIQVVYRLFTVDLYPLKETECFFTTGASVSSYVPIPLYNDSYFNRTLPRYLGPHSRSHEALMYLHITVLISSMLLGARHAHYELGLTPLVLVWKDIHCCQYLLDTDSQGNVPAYQQV